MRKETKKFDPNSQNNYLMLVQARKKIFWLLNSLSLKQEDHHAQTHQLYWMKLGQKDHRPLVFCAFSLYSGAYLLFKNVDGSQQKKKKF